MFVSIGMPPGSSKVVVAHLHSLCLYFYEGLGKQEVEAMSKRIAEHDEPILGERPDDSETP